MFTELIRRLTRAYSRQHLDPADVAALTTAGAALAGVRPPAGHRARMLAAYADEFGGDR